MDDFQEALFGYVRETFANDLTGRPVMPAQPLMCDRWVARSALQKAIRRGETGIAVSALATLFNHDPKSVWRHLIIIAMEDVGVANIDVLARTVAARLDRKWRCTVGGDWRVASALVQEMAESTHCQAACDLLLVAMNKPELARERSAVVATCERRLAAVLAGGVDPIEHRAIAAMALAGADHRSKGDPALAFACLSQGGAISLVIATGQAAWRATRNPMALMLPLLYPAWKRSEVVNIVDDVIQPTTMINGVPGYAIDQFTRIGGAVQRALLARCPDLRDILGTAGINVTSQSRLLGDLTFLFEGSALVRRQIWVEADSLRRPFRQLPAVNRLGIQTSKALALVSAKADLIARLRRHHFLRSTTPFTP